MNTYRAKALSNLAGTNSLEIEIHNIFQEGTSVDYVCSELLNKYEKRETLSAFEIEGLSHFLMTCGRFDLLQKMYINCLKKSKLSHFPVGFIIDNFFLPSLFITDSLQNTYFTKF